jgi:multiple sugar transport system ATP-binding protein
MSDIVLNGLSKRFGAIEAVRDVSLEIADGEFVVLLGPTGAGKTTLLRLIAGLERADQGVVRIGGRDAANIPPALRDVSFVFQRYSLYPHLTVFENLAFPLRAPMRRMDKGEIKRIVEQTAQLVRIEHKLHTPVTRLSGGEMQRVAIGRALVRRPAVYLMDEPLSSLDAKLRAELRLELKHIQQDLGATVLYVTHDQTEAMTMATRIGILDAGRIVQVGTPREIYEQPLNSYVAQRLGTPRINLLPAASFGEGMLPQEVATVGARSEHLHMRADTQGPALVTLVEHLGNETHVHLEAGGRQIVCLASPGDAPHTGSRMQVTFSEALYFDQNGSCLVGAAAERERNDLVLH